MASAIVTPSFTKSAQALDPAVVQEAQNLCVENAKTKGFDLKEVVSAGPADVAGKDAKIVLNLTKAGQEYKQTCYYDKNSKSVFFGDDAKGAVTTPETTYQPALWWVLAPLIGLPLLLWATRNRGKEEVTRAAAVKTYANRYYDAIVRTVNGEATEVYEEPNYNSKVIRSILDGESVRVTGLEDKDWFELAGGGWIPKKYVRTTSHA